MPRRGKLELFGLIDEAIGLYNKGMTIAEIESKLREQGYDISRESVRRGLKGAEKVAERYRKIVAQSQAIMEAVKDSPNTEMSEVALALMSQQALDYAMHMDELEFKNPNDVASFLRSVSLSQTQLAKLRADDEKKNQAIKEQILSRLENSLSSEALSEVAAALRGAF